MARVDINDNSVTRYSVWHHDFDVETNHFRWILVDCFDNEREMNALLRDRWAELDIRRQNGGSHIKEQFVGRIKKSSSRRLSLLRK